MRLKYGKNEEKFKKHWQAEFQVIILKNCLYKKMSYKTRKKVEKISSNMPQKLVSETLHCINLISFL